MGIKSATVEIAVPVQDVFEYVNQFCRMKNNKVADLYDHLTGGRRYSGNVKKCLENDAIVLTEGAVDGLLGFMFSGWTISYQFEPIDDNSTRVSITVEYGFLMAVIALSTANDQATAAVFYRASALLALEKSYVNRYQQCA